METYMTIEEVAEYLKLAEQTIRRWVLNRSSALLEILLLWLYNGSEILIGGLGNKEQAGKILGHEYNTIYLNEISQLTYVFVTTAYSRLAMKVQGCRNMFFYDCNPSSPLHWAYKIFVLKWTFFAVEPLEKVELYQSMVLNPQDNRDNLPDDYISDILDCSARKTKSLQTTVWKAGLSTKYLYAPSDHA